MNMMALSDISLNVNQELEEFWGLDNSKVPLNLGEDQLKHQ